MYDPFDPFGRGKIVASGFDGQIYEINRADIDYSPKVSFNRAEFRRLDGLHQVQLFFDSPAGMQYRYQCQAIDKPDIYDAIMRITEGEEWEVSKLGDIWIYRLPRGMANINLNTG